MVMAVPAIHSGARYPTVPRIVVSTRLKSRPMSLASPKSATLGTNASSRRMFSGLMSQWMMQSRHLSCRYSRPVAIPRAIWYLDSQLRTPWPPLSNRCLSREPLGMCS